MNAILEVLTKDNIAFFADKIIPILTLLGAVFAAIAAIYKYFNEKNREFYMSVLNDVYEPLYEEIVKMEYARKFLKKSLDKTDDKVKVDGKLLGKNRFNIKYLPFVYLNNTKATHTYKIGKVPETKIETKNIYNIDIVLEELLKNVNLNYAPKDLVSLLKVYFFMGNLKGDDEIKFSVEQKKIQRLIRKNIIVGYKKYRRKLGLKDVTVDKFCYSIGGRIFFR